MFGDRRIASGVIRLIRNRMDKTISVHVNNVDLGVAFTGVPMDNLYAVVHMNSAGAEVHLGRLNSFPVPETPAPGMSIYLYAMIYLVYLCGMMYLIYLCAMLYLIYLCAMMYLIYFCSMMYLIYLCAMMYI